MSERRDFWARRKAAVAAEAEAEEVARLAEPELRQKEELEEKTDAEILEELGLPEPESLQAGDDFSAFMAKAVPDRIRRRALRLLWRTNPVLANLDELVDYGEDFTDSAMAVEAIQTTYQVGKGMLAHIEKMAADAEAEAMAQNAPGMDGDVEPEIALADEDETLEDIAPMALPYEPEDVPEDTDDTYQPAPRRMTFTYESDTA